MNQSTLKKCLLGRSGLPLPLPPSVIITAIAKQTYNSQLWLVILHKCVGMLQWIMAVAWSERDLPMMTQCVGVFRQWADSEVHSTVAEHLKHSASKIVSYVTFVFVSFQKQYTINYTPDSGVSELSLWLDNWQHHHVYCSAAVLTTLIICCDSLTH